LLDEERTIREIEYLQRKLGRSSIETEDELNWGETKSSLIRVAGIYYTHGFRQDELNEIITTLDDPRRQELIAFLLNINVSGSHYNNFLRVLLNTIQKNRDLFPEISDDDSQPGLGFSFGELPLDVIGCLLAIIRS